MAPAKKRATPTVAEDVQPGRFFMTPSNQIRKVVAVRGSQDKPRVEYVAKSANNRGRPFTYGHVSPRVLQSEMSVFLKECGRLLSADEVSRLRAQGVLLEGE